MYSGPELGEGFGFRRKVAAERRTAPLRSATFSLVTMVLSMRGGREEGQTSGCREWVISCISWGEDKPALALRLFAVARVGMTKGSKWTAGCSKEAIGCKLKRRRRAESMMLAWKEHR